MPGLVEDATNLKLPNIAPDRSNFMHETLSKKIFSHLHSTYEWRALWEKENPNACYEFVPGDNASATYGIGIELVFPSVIHFSNLTCAHEITLYNVMLLLLLKLGTEVIGPTFDHTVSAPKPPRVRTNTPLLFPGKASTVQEIATEICKSIHYHLLDEHSSAGPFHLLFPIRTAYQAFAPSSKGAGWLRAMMRHIANLSGFEISRKLSSQIPVKYTVVKTAHVEEPTWKLALREKYFYFSPGLVFLVI